MRLRVLHHGSCFDGASSAGIFARFFRECVARGPVDVAFTPMDHKEAGPAIPPESLDGDVNACVDFRYTSDARLHWWFDHHVSTFQSAADEAHFRADQNGQKFYDPSAKSCTRFLARTVAEKFGFDISSLQELLHWAEIIDGALFESAAQAVELHEPALRLMTWVEANRDPRAVRAIHRGRDLKAARGGRRQPVCGRAAGRPARTASQERGSDPPPGPS